MIRTIGPPALDMRLNPSLRGDGVQQSWEGARKARRVGRDQPAIDIASVFSNTENGLSDQKTLADRVLTGRFCCTAKLPNIARKRFLLVARVSGWGK
jgi:hypothetical protein